MPALQNDRHEKFVQAIIAKKLCATDAYKSVYGEDKSDNVANASASRLLRYATISQRMAEIREKSAKRFEITLESMIGEFEEAAQLARDSDQCSAVIAALTAKAKLAGLWVERAENLNGNYAISDAPLSEEEWLARHVK
jgi:hypothetical protein